MISQQRMNFPSGKAVIGVCEVIVSLTQRSYQVTVYKQHLAEQEEKYAVIFSEGKT